MSKVLQANYRREIMSTAPNPPRMAKDNVNHKSSTTPIHNSIDDEDNSSSTETTTSPTTKTAVFDFDDFTSSSSIMEFLKQEQNCYSNGVLDQDHSQYNGHDSEVDTESIFQEVSRLADNSDTRSVEELLREAELLLQHQYMGSKNNNKQINNKNLKNQKKMDKNHITMSNVQLNETYTKSIDNIRPSKSMTTLTNGHHSSYSMGSSVLLTPRDSTPETPTPTNVLAMSASFHTFVDNLPSESVISEESTPPGLQGTTHTITANSTGLDITTKQMDGDDTDGEGTDTIEEITEAMETIELIVHDDEDEGARQERLKNGLEYAETDKQMDPQEIHPPTLNGQTQPESNDVINASAYSSITSTISTATATTSSTMVQQQQHVQNLCEFPFGIRPSHELQLTNQTSSSSAAAAAAVLASPLRRLAPNTGTGTSNNTSTNSNNSNTSNGSSSSERRNSALIARRSSMTTPDSGVSSQAQLTHRCHASPPPPPRSSSPVVKSIGIGTATRSYCDKSVNSSPRHMVSTLTSPIESHSSLASITREHALKQEIEQLQERLKDTEERLESFRIQHDTNSQLHRKLRENNTQLQEESEMLKLDVQHLTECANVLRTELKSARADRNEALELQKTLQMELEEARAEKKKAQELKEKDVKTIQDLQRQCREMERILMRKHPDSVSALIVASKSSGMSRNDQENLSSRKLLEQRIAQLEADAKEQDNKAQQILANVQARFNSVQSKYETHIADLETQVLSLQEINTKLNEKIESQVRTLDYFVSKKAERYYNNCTQTEEIYLQPVAVQLLMTSSSYATPTTSNADARITTKSASSVRKTISTQTLHATRESGTNTIGTSIQLSASSSCSSTANSTPNNSRPNSKQSCLRKPMASAMGSLSSAISSKLPISQSDSTISLSAAQAHANAKEDAHLLATIRGMRVDLAIKNKALQRLSRELDECKKTIKKLQREKEAFKNDKPHSSSTNTAMATSNSTVTRFYMEQHNNAMPATTEHQALKEAQNKYKLLEADYKSLHDKRLQDLKTLQTAHERELASCHETVRILQQRLNERDEQHALQKRRKLPVDYYALKAKVSSLERRHTEREERLHMLVEALSKGRLNGALDDLLTDNNNQ